MVSGVTVSAFVNMTACSRNTDLGKTAEKMSQVFLETQIPTLVRRGGAEIRPHGQAALSPCSCRRPDQQPELNPHGNGCDVVEVIQSKRVGILTAWVDGWWCVGEKIQGQKSSVQVRGSGPG